MRAQVLLAVGASLVLSAAQAAAAGAIDHAAWDELTERYVTDGRVNYEGVAAQREALDRYLASLAEADPSQLPSDQARLAFWINAYNACVFQGVLDHDPLSSVKDIKGFFDRLRYRVAGRALTLNEIEDEGRRLGDWRIHFAVVCASASCPPIRSEAYQADWLDPQLTEQVKGFLRNARDGLRLDGDTLWVSSIFKWYAKDFVPGKMVPGALLPVLAPYLAPEILEATNGKHLTLKFLNYDWSLNVKQER